MMSKHTKMSTALTEEQQVARLDGFSLRSGDLTLTNHEAECRLHELSKAAAGMKKLLVKAEEDAHCAALADHQPGKEHKFRNEMVLRRMRRAAKGIEMVLVRLESLMSEYQLKDGIKK